MDGSIGIYVHIPFCVRKCRYCDFPSFEGRNDRKKKYFNSLFKEIREETATEGRKVPTIYIGGGTPSSVPPVFIYSLMEELRRKYRIDPDAEISMELNPGTAVPEALKIYREAGINRISVGCQSFNDKSLKRLGRIHNREDILITYDMIRNAGFDNVNLDLISSLPGESVKDLEYSLESAISLEPGHISVYSLILEPGTEFYREYEDKIMTDIPDEDQQCENDRLVRNMLESASYKRYEISNYSRAGKECRHNQNYWNRGDYRGFGLSAASLTGNRRFANTDDMDYMVSPGHILKEDHMLSEREAMEEFMFLGLRQCRGVSEEDFLSSFGCSLLSVFYPEIREQIRQGFMRYEDGRYYYTEKGLDVSNVLLARFLK